jgi:hypothetical protein
LLRYQPAWGKTIAGFRALADTKGITTIPDGSGFERHYKVAETMADDRSASSEGN